MLLERLMTPIKNGCKKKMVEVFALKVYKFTFASKTCTFIDVAFI